MPHIYYHVDRSVQSSDPLRSPLSGRFVDSEEVPGGGGELFQDFQNLSRVWNHPQLLQLHKQVRHLAHPMHMCGVLYCDVHDAFLLVAEEEQ